MKRLAISLFFLFVLVLPLESAAAWRATCGVSYKTQIGYSDDYTMSVIFATGKELNKATSTFDYDYFEVYAAIWFEEGEVALVKLDRIFIGVGDIFDEEDFANAFHILSSVEGKDQQGKRWRIKTQRVGTIWM